MFEHYVFRNRGAPADHLPPERRGILGAASPEQRRRMKAFLIQGLGRR